MYTDEKVTLKNHTMSSVKRLMTQGDIEGSAANAAKLLEVGVWLDGVKTTERPPAVPRPVKK